MSASVTAWVIVESDGRWRREDKGERRGKESEQLLSVSLALRVVRARVVACVIVYRGECTEREERGEDTGGRREKRRERR